MSTHQNKQFDAICSPLFVKLLWENDFAIIKKIVINSAGRIEMLTASSRYRIRMRRTFRLDLMICI